MPAIWPASAPTVISSQSTYLTGSPLSNPCSSGTNLVIGVYQCSSPASTNHVRTEKILVRLPSLYTDSPSTSLVPDELTASRFSAEW